MKRFVLIGAVTLLVLSLHGAAFAVPMFLPVQGYLTEADGTPIDGSVEIAFTLRTAGDDVLFTETQSVEVERGYFTAFVGQGETSLDSSYFESGDAESLGIEIDGELAVLPLGSVPYAVAAGHAETATNAEVADFATNADHATQADTAANAQNAQRADFAETADAAATADSATTAQTAQTADDADRLQGMTAASLQESLSCSRVLSPYTTIPPDALRTITVDCPSGTILMSVSPSGSNIGGTFVSAGSYTPYGSDPTEGTCRGRNLSSSADVDFRCMAICCSVE